VLSKGEKYKERGGDYFDRINSEQTKIKLIRRLERLGFEVELKPKQATV
jgi:transposase